MNPLDIISGALVVFGLLFFLAGTAGMLRFPDVYTRLHALTKADNVGLGFLVLGLMLQAVDWREVVELLLIWLLVMLASTTAAHIIAATALGQDISPWKEVRR